MVQALGRRGDSKGCNGVQRLPGETKGLNHAASGEEKDCAVERTTYPKSMVGKEGWSKGSYKAKAPYTCEVRLSLCFTPFLDSTI